MKKRNVAIGLGIGTALIAACEAAKILFDKKHANDDINDDEIKKINYDEEQDDRGVAPVSSTEDKTNEGNDDVSDLKADAINHGYKPIKY